MGAAAARRFQSWLEETLRARPTCRVMFGCAPSQDDFFAALRAEAAAAPAPWRRVEVFHMDDYVGLPEANPQSFRAYLRRQFLDHVEVAQFHPIRGETEPVEREAARYAALLARAPIDVVSLGIGENGHLAFNDPPVADPDDPVLAKVVELDAVCRQQQVNDGCFGTLAEVPRLAITVTLPVFAQAGRMCCIVPGARKAEAVRRTLTDPVGPACPATLLRVHPMVQLFLDSDAAALLPADLRR